jgi:hypothetical protein
MRHEVAPEKQQQDDGRRDREPEDPTVEVELRGRKVQIRQQTVPSGIGVGIERRLRRLLG